MSIKVLNITEEGRGGGPLKRIRQIAKGLQNENIDTLVLFPKKNADEFAELLTKDNVNFLQIPLHRLTKEKKTLLKYIFGFFFEVFNIKQIIKKQNIDIVHCNGAWQIKGIIASKLSHSRSIWHMNDTYQSKPIRLLFKMLGHWADGFIYASSKTKEYYQAINPKIKKLPSKIIQAPVDVNKFCPGSKKELLKSKNPKLISIGYVNNNKGFETLINAINIIAQSGQEVSLYIVGTIFQSQQSYYQKLEKLIEKHQLNNISFLGYRSDVLDLLHSADLYVCSSDFEASPIAVWEALASGIPVVSTDVGDVKKIFNNNECGAVVPTNSPTKLADAVINLLKNPELADKYAKNGRITAEKLFSTQASINNHKKFYQQIKDI